MFAAAAYMPTALGHPMVHPKGLQEFIKYMHLMYNQVPHSPGSGALAAAQMPIVPASRVSPPHSSTSSTASTQRDSPQLQHHHQLTPHQHPHANQLLQLNTSASSVHSSSVGGSPPLPLTPTSSSQQSHHHHHHHHLASMAAAAVNGHLSAPLMQ